MCLCSVIVKNFISINNSKFCDSEMTKRYVPLVIQRQWDIEGYPNYFFGNDSGLYRITSRGEIRSKCRAMKRYTQGYVLKSRFYSLAQLRTMLRRHIPTDHPGAI